MRRKRSLFVVGLLVMASPVAAEVTGGGRRGRSGKVTGAEFMDYVAPEDRHQAR